MNTKPMKTILVRTMYIMVILVVTFSVTSAGHAAPFATPNEPIGDRLNLYYGGSITFPASEPFHIVHGHAVSSDSDAIGIYDFELDVNGDSRKADFKDFGAESGEPDTLLRRWVYNFPEGMDEGTYEFTGHWFEPCRKAVDEGVYTEPCSTPNEKVETYTQTLTVEFTTEPPEMGLRVNYGHDWVESFYQTGHEVLITVTDPDGNIKATAEAVTEQKGYWDGEPGFQTNDSTWSDADGNPMDNPPDIQPKDWVYTVVDNGRTAQVQIGEISGTIDLANDSIGGTINAPWFSDQVQVECLDWGSGQEPPLDTIQDGSILTDNSESYSCYWDEWNIQPGQDVGVGYLGPDGNWVANAFFVPMPTFVAYLPWAIEGYDWPIEDTIKIYINDQYIAQAVSEQRPGSPEGTTRVLFDVGQYGVTLQTNDHIVMTDESIDVSKEVWVTNLAVTDFDLDAGQVFGTFTYNPESESQDYLWVWLYDADGQVPTMSPDSTWVATFTELPPGAWGGATQSDGDGDGTSIDFQVPKVPYTHVFIANQVDWVDSGIAVSAGQSFTIEALGLMNPCSDTYPNGADYCISYRPWGAEGEVPYENEFGIFPGPGLPFMALLGRIGDGEPFYIGSGGTFTAVEPGTLWFTPNDNLRTDNQGAYIVLVWLEP